MDPLIKEDVAGRYWVLLLRKHVCPCLACMRVTLLLNVLLLALVLEVLNALVLCKFL